MTYTIIGKKGKGKSNALAVFIARRNRPTVIVDNMHQFPQYKRVINVDEFIDLVMDNKFVITDPICINIFEQDEFSKLCSACIVIGNVLLAIDEVDLFDSPVSVNSEFKKIMHYQRHYDIDIVTTCRRPSNISRDLTSQTDLFIIYQITETRDLKYFSDMCKALVEEIKTLPNYHYIEYDCENFERKFPLPYLKTI